MTEHETSSMASAFNPRSTLVMQWATMVSDVEEHMRHSLIPMTSPSEWAQALIGIPHTFAHTWEHCYAMQLTTDLPTYLYSAVEDDIRIVCPITEREFKGHVDIATPLGLPGFVGTKAYPRFPTEWKAFARTEGYVCGYIGLNPIFTDRSYYDARDVTHDNSVYAIDLTMSRDELLSRLDRNRKRQIKSIEQSKENLIFNRQVISEFLVENYASFMRRVGTPAYYQLSGETLSFLSSLENLFMIGMEHDGVVESVHVFSYTKYSGDSLFSISLPEGRHHNTTLLWHGLEYLKSIGIPILNLGGGMHENDSIARYKQRFGPKRLPIMKLKEVYNQLEYDALCRRMERDPTDIREYFPAYRRPEILSGSTV